MYLICKPFAGIKSTERAALGDFVLLLWISKESRDGWGWTGVLMLCWAKLELMLVPEPVPVQIPVPFSASSRGQAERCSEVSSQPLWFVQWGFHSSWSLLTYFSCRLGKGFAHNENIFSKLNQNTLLFQGRFGGKPYAFWNPWTRIKPLKQILQEAGLFTTTGGNGSLVHFGP